MRSAPEAPPERVLVLTTLGAPQGRPRRARRGAVVSEADHRPVPTSRVTVITPEPFAGRTDAERWLHELRDRRGGADAQVEGAVRVVNRALHADRAARADPVARDVASGQARTIRVGFGDGDAVAEGRYEEAWELPRGGRARARRSMEAPEERFAALIGARERTLVCEELLLRARADLNAGRSREAALQARVALESLLCELGDEIAGERRAGLEGDRRAVAEAANAALREPPSEELAVAVEGAVGKMEAALRAHRLESPS